MEADWIVTEITKSKDHYYRLHVSGRNLSSRDNPEFSWHVRDVADPRYDLTNAKIDPAAIPFLGR